VPFTKEVFITKVYFKGQTGIYKTRPVLILNYDDVRDVCTLVEITSVAPKDPPKYYDTFKEEIMYWELCGLDEKSYVKCKNVHNVHGLELNQKIGIMHDDDFYRIVEKIINSI
jgi:mRNA interferase MazF